jgi:hypothetical protein
VRIDKFRQESGFALEATYKIGATGEIALEDFNGNGSIYGDLTPSIDGTHAPLPESLIKMDLVITPYFCTHQGGL